MAGGGWVATFDDITDQRRAERERDRNQAFLNTVINKVPATIFVQDAHDRRYLLINGAGEKYSWCYARADVGKTPRELFSGSFADLIEEREEQFIASGAEQFLRRGRSSRFPASGRRGHHHDPGADPRRPRARCSSSSVSSTM